MGSVTHEISGHGSTGFWAVGCSHFTVTANFNHQCWRMKILRRRYNSICKGSLKRDTFEPRTLSISWHSLKCNKGSKQQVRKRRQYVSELHNVGCTTWAGAMAVWRMACTLMVMKNGNGYEKRMRMFDNEGDMENFSPQGFPVPAGQVFKLILVTHNESIFFENDCQKNCWSHVSKWGAPQKKGEGVSLMVSDFLTTEWGRLTHGNEWVKKHS